MDSTKEMTTQQTTYVVEEEEKRDYHEGTSSEHKHSTELKKADIVEYNYNLNKEEEEESKPSFISKQYQKHRKIYLVLIWLIFTGFLSAAYALQVPKGYSQENLILGLIYAWHSIYVFFCFAPTTIVTKPWMFLVRAVYKPISGISSRIRSLIFAALVVAVIIVTVFSLPETPESTRVQRLIALVGLFVFLGFTFAASNNHRAVQWNTVSAAILIQFLLGVFVFRSKAGFDIFNWLSGFVKGYLGKATEALEFLLNKKIVEMGMFATGVFPAVIFFAATVQILYYIGALQWCLAKSAVVFVNILNISGAEAVVAVASPWLGQSENALLIKPFLPHMTNAEFHQIMTSGFATVSGSVLYGYISIGVDPVSLLTSCVMSIPCSIAISKLRYPETEEPLTKGEVRVPQSEEKLEGIVHAAGIGAATGIQICLLIAANIIALLALLYAVNSGLTWVGNFLTIHELTLQLVTGYILVPVAFFIGADKKDLVTVGQLIATKLWANEFVAYIDMIALKDTLTKRSLSVTTYALCGFANLGSIGMQVGVLTALAPNKSKEITQVAVSAMICGAISTFVSASLAGMLF
ncbi:unnamed protein product [Cunninghamella echinulata]